MKKALKIIFNVLAWIVLILALLVTIMVFSADRNDGVASLLGYIPVSVESNSMKPTFEENDMIIVREIDDVAELEEGDVITYWTTIDGEEVKNTHRIVSVISENGNYSFVTRGDNNSADDDTAVSASKLIGKWTEVKISGLGAVLDFLKTKKGFFICIIIPMAIFFLFELYKLIVTIVEIRQMDSEIDEEEIKKRAIEEYLAEQGKKEQPSEPDDTNKLDS